MHKTNFYTDFFSTVWSHHKHTKLEVVRRGRSLFILPSFLFAWLRWWEDGFHRYVAATGLLVWYYSFLAEYFQTIHTPICHVEFLAEYYLLESFSTVLDMEFNTHKILGHCMCPCKLVNILHTGYHPKGEVKIKGMEELGCHGDL